MTKSVPPYSMHAGQLISLLLLLLEQEVFAMKFKLKITPRYIIHHAFEHQPCPFLGVCNHMRQKILSELLPNSVPDCINCTAWGRSPLHHFNSCGFDCIIVAKFWLSKCWRNGCGSMVASRGSGMGCCCHYLAVIMETINTL